MLKKMIAILTICAMLAPLSSAVAADNTTVTPTIEEILNEYREKTFEAQTQEETNTAATYSRRSSGSTQTLEQETVNTLTDAGYEAYNVTADNYDSLEASLKTDFSSMGLDPDSSYIMVIDDTASSRAIGGSDIVQDPGDLSGGSGIRHTYNGVTYTMRSVTIASNDDPSLIISSAYAILEEKDTADHVSDVLSFLFSWGIDSLCFGLPVTSAYSLWSNWSSTEVYYVLDSSKPTLMAATNWNLRYTQVWDDILGRWATTQCSSYAQTNARVTGYVYNYGIGAFDVIDSGNKTATVYSYYYNRYDRYDLAAKGFIEEVVYRDYCDVGFYFFNNNDVCINADGSPLFVHKETAKALFPYYEYED